MTLQERAETAAEQMQLARLWVGVEIAVFIMLFAWSLSSGDWRPLTAYVACTVITTQQVIRYGVAHHHRGWLEGWSLRDTNEP